MSLTDAMLRDCTASSWSGDPKACRWCNQPLAGRRRRWCSDGCSNAWARNHMWTVARGAAIHRTPLCIACGASPRLVRMAAEALTHELGIVVRVSSLGHEIDVWLPEFEWPTGEGKPGARSRTETEKVCLGLLKEFAGDSTLEVDHVQPILGRHGQTGCHHHQDGLQVLCRACHRRKTREDFGWREQRTGPPQARLPFGETA